MGRATVRSKPAMPGEDLDARLAAALDAAESLLAHPEGLCEAVAVELVNVSDQLAALRVAHEDSMMDAFAITAAFAAGVAEGEKRAAQRQQVPGPRKPTSHKQRPLTMRLLDGGVKLIAAGAAFRAVKAAAAAHHVGAAAASTAAAAVTVSAVTAAVIVPAVTATHHPGGGPGGFVTHGAVIQAAVPVSGQQQKLIAAVTKTAPRKHGHPASLSASSSLPLSPPSAPVTVSSPATQDPSSSSAPPQGPAEGALGATTQGPVSDPTQPAVITLTATGGPVPWGVTCSSGPCQDVTLSARHGEIDAGGSVDITVTFDAAAQASGGTAVFTFQPGDVQVTLTWDTVPPPAPVDTSAATPPPSQDPSLPGS